MGTRPRKRDGKGHVDPYFQRRQRFRTVMETLGLAEAFEAMPRWMLEQFWVRKNPDPMIEFDGARPDHATRIVSKYNENLHQLEFTHDGRSMLVRDYFAIVHGCHQTLQNIEMAGMPESVVAFVAQARPIFADWVKGALTAALTVTCNAISNAILPAATMDEGFWWVTPELHASPAGKPMTRFVLRGTKAQSRQVTLDGEPRQMFRAAAHSGIYEPKWVSWTGAQVGRADATAELPVYVQRHALLALAKRANLPQLAPYAQAWLGMSLRDPKIALREPGGDLLVEYRVKDNRLGYLVCTVLDDLVAVRTFLFLTMEGTPESRLLRRELKLTRRDVDWLGLSDLSAFTQTDLRNDAVLRQLFDRCGCGHLFTLEHFDYAPQPKPFAAEMRKYLRLAA